MPTLSIILPANNEAAHIAQCLSAVLASEPLAGDAPVQIIVVPNGCTDETAEIAHSFAAPARDRGWQLEVIELAQGGKLAALNAGDAEAKGRAMAYLDADVIISPMLLAQTAAALDHKEPSYASGAVQLGRAQSWATRAYGAFYLQTPFMKQAAPGCGYFAMNRQGRRRWAQWPAIISDDTFARLSFSPRERQQLEASYEWPLVEGLRNLIGVRRRQNAGVTELAEKNPELLQNDAKTSFAPIEVLKAALCHPFGTIVYGIVSLTVKLSPAKTTDWKRGR